MANHNLFGSTELLFQKAYKHYNKTENEVAQAVEMIEKWIETRPHLPEVMPDTHIRNFLVMNKFRTEKTQMQIDNYYTIRAELADFLGPKFTKNIEINYPCVHPELIQGLHRVFFYKFEARILWPQELAIANSRIGEICCFEDCVFETVHIIDMADFRSSNITKFTPNVLVKMAAIQEKVYTLNFKAFYYINVPPYISTIVKIIKSLIKPKVFEKIHFHANGDILKTIFTNETLPKDYGGNGPSFKEMTDMIKIKVKKYQGRFDQLDKMRVDERLRPPQLVDDDFLGFHGSFKKLDID